MGLSALASGATTPWIIPVKDDVIIVAWRAYKKLTARDEKARLTFHGQLNEVTTCFWCFLLTDLNSAAGNKSFCTNLRPKLNVDFTSGSVDDYSPPRWESHDRSSSVQNDRGEAARLPRRSSATRAPRAELVLHLGSD